MAIKGKKSNEVISVYDPALKAYHEVEVSALEAQLAGLGFTPDEIAARIEQLKAAKEE